MVWTKVLAENELPTDSRQVVKLENHTLLLLNHEGQLYAVDNRCPHLKLSMKKGRISQDGAIICPWHRSEFDLCTGEAKTWITWPPVVSKAMAMVSSAKNLPTFPIKQEEGNIWVDLA
ncbi:MAG: Rieske (2Fe-2S) protein [Microcystaceae cyanobacterium]